MSRLFIFLVEDPKRWPQWARRVYILTLPLAFALRLVFIILALIVCGGTILCYDAYKWVRTLWCAP